MRTLAVLLLLAAGVSGQETPKSLPAELIESPVGDPGAVVRFEPERLTVKRVGGRSQLWAGDLLLKDFGPNESEARDAMRLVRDMRFNQYGTIPGSSPAFEYWLCDGEASKGGLAVRNVIPFSGAALQLTDVGGAWVIRDDKMMLYNFGVQKEAAERAFGVMRKFGFNQLGVVGVPNPVMTYLLTDPYARAPQAKAPPPTREIAFQVSQQGLVLPDAGYVGSRALIEQRKLDTAKVGYDWVVVHGKDVIGNFGPNMHDARAALKVLQDARITEVCKVGKAGFPIYLSQGQAPRQAGLGFNNLRIKPADMKVQIVNNVACLTEEGRIVFEFGSREDAELVLKVLQHYRFDQISPVGDMRLLIKTR